MNIGLTNTQRQGVIDLLNIAEGIRTLGGYPVGTMEGFLKN